ncbi:phenylalanine--tRNA ligase subunit alpha [Crocinitomix catalasitica]|uniref:phenylalanine--tRNA ligase subunit alpha n=1 Tax=Crocinitomix catalasitica TaxID=184607 RepID=UPI000480E2A9|nr:phenylalanine--tRNA ligase subunit alpha [Crocinitomix catalasitica]
MSLKEKIEQIQSDIAAAKVSNAENLEQYRIKYLGAKNIFKGLYQDLKDIAAEEKKEFGQRINALKKSSEDRFEELKALIDSTVKVDTTKEQIDLSRPVIGDAIGARHPLAIVRKQLIEVFAKIGFTVSEGPEIEDDWHNFSALNFPPEHPARDMQDTFFIEKGENEMALRTHTSSVQVRVMENSKPPIRTISPGRVYRNEAISARAHCFFHQLEGLYIDKNVSFADLKQTLDYFAREVFGEETKIRLRPSYFPFTEPSAELDVSCTICKGKGCNVCKYSGWLEILGCGMVDPAVLEAANIDSKVYSGFAFGMGVERIAQLKYRVGDLRLYSENDMRFLDQFKSAY